MRSFSVISGENALAQQFINLRADAQGAGNLLVHQQLGALTLSTNPANTKTLTLDINGTNIVFTFVSSIGSTAGNVLIGASAAATCANLLALLNQPQTTTANGVALSPANQQLVSYLSFALSATTLTVSSNNTSLYAPLSSFTASTTATSDSYTAQTMQLYVEPGVVYVGGTRVIFAGASTPTVTAPSSHPRIDVLSVDNTGALTWTTGAENTSPVAPTYPANKVALCELYNVVGETALYDNANQTSGQGYILNDVRPTIGSSVNLGAVTSAILPDTDGTRNLGSASFEWGNIYAKNGIFLNGVSINSQLTWGTIAGESVTAGQPLYLGVTGGIAFDSSASGTAQTGSITIVAANTVVFLAVSSSSNNLSSAPTIGGNAFTAVDSGGSGSLFYKSWIYVNPPVGANTIDVKVAPTNSSWQAFAVTGATQSTTPDNHHVSTGTSTAPSGTITPTGAGTLAIGIMFEGSGSTFSSPVGQNNNIIIGSGGTPPIASSGGIGTNNPLTAAVTQSVTSNASSAWVALQITLAPSSPVISAFKASSATALTSVGFVGFAASSVSAGASLSAIVEGVDTNHSGLTLGLQYYLNDTAGTIGTSPGTNTRKVGIAVSATALLVANIF